MPAPRNTRQIDRLDALQREDHDTLIRVEQAVQTIALDVKELKEGTALRIAQLEIGMKDNKKEIDELIKEIDRFKAAVSMGKWIIGFQTATISFILASLSGAVDLFRR